LFEVEKRYQELMNSHRVVREPRPWRFSGTHLLKQ
jgi:hypothetical protein